MKTTSFLLSVALLGCEPKFENVDWAALSKAEQEEALQEITEKCRLPSDRLQSLGNNEVRVRPNPNDDYGAVDCMLRGVKTLRGIKLGFVGNEAYVDEARK